VQTRDRQNRICGIPQRDFFKIFCGINPAPAKSRMIKKCGIVGAGSRKIQRNFYTKVCAFIASAFSVAPFRLCLCIMISSNTLNSGSFDSTRRALSNGYHLYIRILTTKMSLITPIVFRVLGYCNSMSFHPRQEILANLYSSR
jgi:hypothetical protein